MARMKLSRTALCVSALLCFAAAAEARARGRTLLGVQLGEEVSGWLEEVEGELGRPVYAEFAELDEAGADGDYALGASYITRAGVGVVRVDESFRGRGERQTRAVIGHELLHLRLRARRYPLFIFSPSVKTKHGPALEVEQSNVNDLVSLIEHRIFAGEMRRQGLDKLVDLTNGLEAARRRAGTEDGQAEMINFARASLEWDDAALLEEFSKVYRANGWERSLRGGREIAEAIRGSRVAGPGAVAPVFLRCMAVLYGADFRVRPDGGFGLARIYPQMIINVRGRRPRGARRR